jgi:uncharacterized protein (DUF302 family)
MIMVFFSSTLSAQQDDSYYFNKTVEGTFEAVTAKTKAELKKQGFGVITEFDMDTKLKEKLDDVDLRPYKILGVCNPAYAWQTIRVEENIGLFLPCKVLVKDMGDGKVEVVMVDPAALMGMLGNEELVKIAGKVSEKFQVALENIN